MNEIEPLFSAVREVGVIRPGDTLILSTGEHVDREQLTDIKRAVEDELPDVHVVVISGLTATVKRADDE